MDSPETQFFKSQKSEKLFHKVTAGRFKTHQQIQRFNKHDPLHRWLKHTQEKQLDASTF